MPVNLDEVFEEMMSDCYDESTKVGWVDFDTITVMKTMDPIDSPYVSFFPTMHDETSS